MDIRKLQRAIVDGLEDVKAQDIVVFNTEHLSPLFERVIIASGTSNRQTKALASSVRESVKKRGLQVMATEGEDNGEWIIVDCGAAVAHIMQPAIREYYHLEEIWGGKPVKMKVDGGARGLPKATEEPPHASVTEATPAGKAAVKKVASRKASVSAEDGKAGAKKAAAKKVAKKVTAKKVAAKKVAAKKVAAKTVAVKKVAAKKVDAKKVAAKKTTWSKAEGGNAKTAARKSPARKATSVTSGKKAAITRTVGTRSAVGAKAGAKTTASRRAAPRKSAGVRR
jgi:ribosome-associated protein